MSNSIYSDDSFAVITNMADDIRYASAITGVSAGAIAGAIVEENDILKGGLGDDTYIFNKGDGQDTIRDFSSDNDTLALTDFSLADLVLGLEGNSLVIEFNAQDVNSTDAITIENWNAPIIGNDYHIETVQLATTTLTDDQLSAMIG